MPFIITYILKLSICLAVVFLFYILVLRKLTFYNANRWYLLGYSLLSFLIPFIDVSAVLGSGGERPVLFQLIPSVESYALGASAATSCPEPVWLSNWDKWDWMLLVISCGIWLFIARLAIRLISFLRLRRKARLVYSGATKVFDVEEAIIPFTFGNSIFINHRQHSESELQEIIRHEFVHVRQRHTIDIVWGELLCILNWYNPFAWRLRICMRQNLEFIADNQVLRHGVDRKQYQYLLLKVIGNKHFSIANQFNFSSLKKRIAMMNKLKSARVHGLRFLFLLPLLAVILISFRKQFSGERDDREKQYQFEQARLTDTVPLVTTPNSKGYVINIIDRNGQCTVVVKDEKGKEVDRLLLTEWNKRDDYYVEKYGEIPPPPPPAPPRAPRPPVAPGEPSAMIPSRLPANVKSITIEEASATVVLKNGTIERYNLDSDEDAASFESRYGHYNYELDLPLHYDLEVPVVEEPPVPEGTPGRLRIEKDGRVIAGDFEITKGKAVMHLKDGQTEVYDLTNPEQLGKFERKYGKVIELNETADGVHAPYAVLLNEQGHTVVAPLSPPGENNIIFTGDEMRGKEDLAVTITRNTTKAQLDEFVKQMRQHGVFLEYEKIEYDNGKLVEIRGVMKSAKGQSRFVAADFSRLVLAVIKDGEKTYFRVRSSGKNEVI